MSSFRYERININRYCVESFDQPGLILSLVCCCPGHDYEHWECTVLSRSGEGHETLLDDRLFVLAGCNEFASLLQACKDAIALTKDVTGIATVDELVERGPLEDLVACK